MSDLTIALVLGLLIVGIPTIGFAIESYRTEWHRHPADMDVIRNRRNRQSTNHTEELL